MLNLYISTQLMIILLLTNISIIFSTEKIQKKESSQLESHSKSTPKFSHAEIEESRKYTNCYFQKMKAICQTNTAHLNLIAKTERDCMREYNKAAKTGNFSLKDCEKLESSIINLPIYLIAFQDGEENTIERWFIFEPETLNQLPSETEQKE